MEYRPERSQIGFLKIVIAIQLAILGFTSSAALGLDILILRQLIGFIYLTFVPGVLVLGILRLYKLNIVETILYSVGISLTFLMVVGFLVNALFPLLGISKPLSLFPFIVTLSVVVLALCAASYRENKGLSMPIPRNIGEISYLSILFLCLLPLLSIVGACLVNFYHANTAFLLLIILISFTVVLASFNKFIPRRLYPLAIFTMALALLYHRSLISSYLVGTDIHFEYALARLVQLNSTWNPIVPFHEYNSTLSVTILPAVYSSVMNLNLKWIFKAVYPLFFALVPLGLYQTWQQQTNDKVAFLSAFFFISLFTFYTEILEIAKTQIAELFVALLILLMVSKEGGKFHRGVLAILFATSLIVSHYAISYLFMLCVLSSYFLLLFFVRIFGKGTAKNRILTGSFGVFYSVVVVSWYLYVSNGITFTNIVHIGQWIRHGIMTELLSFTPEATEPQVLQAIGLASLENVTLQREIARIFHYITQFFIVWGAGEFMLKLLKHRKTEFNQEYTVMILAGLAILLFCVVVPHFSAAIHITRIYHLSLFFLAPLCILGGIDFLGKILRKATFVPAALLLILIPYFLFDTGFIFEVTGDIPSSVSLSIERFKTTESQTAKRWFDDKYIHVQDAFSAIWLAKKTGETATIYASVSAHHHVLTSVVSIRGKLRSLSRSAQPEEEAYVYLKHFNVVDRLIEERIPKIRGAWTTYDIDEISHFFKGRAKIYTNGGSEIYSGKR